MRPDKQNLTRSNDVVNFFSLRVRWEVIEPKLDLVTIPEQLQMG